MISSETFRALAAGGGGTSAAGELCAAHERRILLLLRGVRDAAHQVSHPEAEQTSAGYALLAELQSNHPEPVRDALGYPTVAAWAHRTLLGLTGRRPGPVHPGRLACVAAVAAQRSPTDLSIEVPVEEGIVTLPGLGRAWLPGRTSGSYRRDAIDEVSLKDGSQGWEPLLTLSAEHNGVRASFLLDHLDPDRMPGDQRATDSFEGSEVSRWRSLLSDAWSILVSHHWTTSAEIAGTISMLTPIIGPPGRHVSGTPRQAFGNIGLSTPPTPHAFAETLAHEVQHTKLTALLDTVQLTIADNRKLFYAPWRPDPRPISGLLQGTYAYLGVTGFWRRQRDAENGERALGAHSAFARWREVTLKAVKTMAESELLTEQGRDFVEEMGRTLNAWCTEPVPAEALSRARLQASEHYTSWERRLGPAS